MNHTEHLLTCLSEECLEVAKDISKSNRFGLSDRNPLNPKGMTNQQRIIRELNDLMAVISILEDEGLLPKDWQSASLQTEKRDKVRRFMDYARKNLTLQD